MNEFENMDNDAGVVEVVDRKTDSQAIIGGTAEYRETLVKKYHGGSASLASRLRKEGLFDNESLIIALIEEIIGETDNLLGNQLIAIENGSVRDASIISAKRSEVIEKAIKAVQSKQAFEKESGIDVDSPSMVIIFKYFMKKVQDVFDAMNMDAEHSDIFFSTLGENTDNWKKELRQEFEEMKSR